MGGMLCGPGTAWGQPAKFSKSARLMWSQVAGHHIFEGFLLFIPGHMIVDSHVIPSVISDFGGDKTTLHCAMH